MERKICYQLLPRLHAISKKLISRRGKNENTVKGKPMKISRTKRAKVLFFIDKYAKL